MIETPGSFAPSSLLKLTTPVAKQAAEASFSLCIKFAIVCTGLIRKFLNKRGSLIKFKNSGRNFSTQQAHLGQPTTGSLGGLHVEQAFCSAVDLFSSDSLWVMSGMLTISGVRSQLHCSYIFSYRFI